MGRGGGTEHTHSLGTRVAPLLVGDGVLERGDAGPGDLDHRGGVGVAGALALRGLGARVVAGDAVRRQRRRGLALVEGVRELGDGLLEGREAVEDLVEDLVVRGAAALAEVVELALLAELLGLVRGVVGLELLLGEDEDARRERRRDGRDVGQGEALPGVRGDLEAEPTENDRIDFR